MGRNFGIAVLDRHFKNPGVSVFRMPVSLLSSIVQALIYLLAPLPWQLIDKSGCQAGRNHNDRTPSMWFVEISVFL